MGFTEQVRGWGACELRRCCRCCGVHGPAEAVCRGGVQLLLEATGASAAACLWCVVDRPVCDHLSLSSPASCSSSAFVFTLHPPCH
jgi:hypothetical protein